MTRLLSAEELAERLRGACEAAHVPGASVAIWRGGETVSAVHGLVNATTGVETTPGSLFMVGSVTKALVGVLAMRALEKGALDLDAPVTAYLPALRIGPAPADPAITARRLLSHAGGIDGDLVIDTGDGADCLERYVARCGETDMIRAPGSGYSYSNAGYAILGRLLEVVLDKPFDQALRDEVLDPLGMARSTTLAERAVAYRCAIGHAWDGQALAPLPYARLPRGLGPAGFTLMSTAAELVEFGRLFVEGGRAGPTGEPILKPRSIAEMISPQIDLADGTQWGLGVKLHDWGGTRFVAHAGGVAGQSATLWTAPAHGFVFALCANAYGGSALFGSLLVPLLAEAFQVTPPSAPAVIEVPPTLAPYEGVYANLGAQLRLSRLGERLTMEVTPAARPSTPYDAALSPIDRSRFLVDEATPLPSIAAFSEFDAAGRPHLFWSGEAYRRVDPEQPSHQGAHRRHAVRSR